MNDHSLERVGAYADGELLPDEESAFAEHLRTCTECRRELALIRKMGGAMRKMTEDPAPRSVWERVHLRIARPIGWILLLSGVAIWIALAVVEWYRARTLSAEYLATTAVTIGLVLLFVGVAYEQYQDWRRTPYRDIER